MSFVDKAKNIINESQDKVADAVDKVGDLVDKKTGGKHTDQINKAEQAIKDKLNKQ